MVDYLATYDREIGKAATTAAARRQGPRKKSGLTRGSRKAQLSPKRVSRHSPQRRTSAPGASEENVVRKKKRSKAQQAATRKMIRANKARSRAKRKGKKNPLLVSATKGGKLRTKTVRKGARTSSARKAKKSHSKKGHTKKRAKAKSGGGKSRKRSLAAKKAARTRKRNKAERSARAKKAARARKRKHGGGKKGKSHAKSSKRSSKKKKSKSRKKGKSRKRSAAAKKAARTRKYNAEKREAEMTTYETGKRHKRRPKKNPIANPIPLEGGLDFFSGLFAVTIGYLFASGADRMGSTHALTPSSAATSAFIDAPAAGQIYDSESPQLPIWSSGMRIVFNLLAIAAPMGLSAVIKSKGPKSFFQLMAFGAIARTAGKTAEDGMSLALKTTGFGMRVYAPEMAAQARLAAAGTTAALPGAATATFAGVAKTQTIAAAPPAKQQVDGLPLQNNAPPPAPVLAAPQRTVEGAPARTGGLDTTNHFVSGPAFNPFAATDS